MATIEQAIDVEAPIHTTYRQWTQFEEFPRFMEGVDEVRQTDDTHLHWVADFDGFRREWDAEITEQVPDELLAWASQKGAKNAGVVMLRRLDDDHTRVLLQLEFDPRGIVEPEGDPVGLVSRRAQGDLERFRHLVETGSGVGWVTDQ